MGRRASLRVGSMVVAWALVASGCKDGGSASGSASAGPVQDDKKHWEVASGVRITKEKKARIAKFADAALLDLLNDKRVVSQSHLEDLYADGLPWLADDDLEKFFPVRSKLAGFSRQVCAGLWEGKLDPDRQMEAISALEDEDLKAYFDVVARSVTAALANKGKDPPEADQTSIVTAVQKVAASLPKEDHDKLEEMVKPDFLHSEDASCWQHKTISAGLLKVDKKLRVATYRAMILPATIDPSQIRRPN